MDPVVAASTVEPEPAQIIPDLARCRLTELPDELRALVHGHLRLERDDVQNNSQFVGPLSKALLPFTQGLLYHHIYISTEDQLRKLCDAFATDPAKGQMMRELEVTSAGWEDAAAAELPGLLMLSAKLRELDLSLDEPGHPSLLRLILSPMFALHCCPSLEALYVSLSPVLSFSNGLARQLSSLGRHPSITLLHIDLDLDPETPLPRLDSTFVPPSNLFKNVKRLILTARCTPQSCPHLAQFVSMFTSLEYLCLDGIGTAVQSLAPILEAVHVGKLKELKLVSTGAVAPAPIDTTLRRFTSLEVLNFGDTLFSDRIYDSLRRLPKLRSLTFDGEMVVPITPLTAFLDSFKPRPFELHLEHFAAGVRGESYGGDFVGEHRRDEAGKVVPLEEWSAPAWSEDYTVESVSQLVKVAKSRGIKIGDALWRAIAIQREYVEELHHAAVAQVALDDTKRGKLLWEGLDESGR